MTHTNSHLNKAFLAALVVVIVSCKSQEQDSGRIQDESTSDTTTSSIQMSPSAPSALVNDSTTEFNEFLMRFIAEITTQRSAIDNKLKHSYVDANAEPEPTTVHTELSGNKVEFPIFPLDSTRQQQKLVYEIDSITNDSMVVILQKPDTDYRIKYHFHRESKWILDWIEDLSL